MLSLFGIVNFIIIFLVMFFIGGSLFIGVPTATAQLQAAGELSAFAIIGMVTLTPIVVTLLCMPVIILIAAPLLFFFAGVDMSWLRVSRYVFNYTLFVLSLIMVAVTTLITLGGFLLLVFLIKIIWRIKDFTFLELVIAAPTIFRSRAMSIKQSIRP